MKTVDDPMTADETTMRESLADFLLADRGRAIAASQAIAAGRRWRRAIELTEQWKALPHFLARVQRLAVELPRADDVFLKRAVLQASGFSLRRASRALAAIRTLEEAGIRVAAIKGIAAIALLYHDPKYRTIQDADLLIERNDLFKAVAILERDGFSRRSPTSLEEYVQFVVNAPGFAGNKAVTLYGEDCEIDLHWELSGSGLLTREILERRVQAALKGAAVPVADAADSLLLTVHHAIRDNLAVESICRDLVDAARWCEKLHHENRIEPAARRLVESKSAAPALGVLSVVCAYETTQGVAEMMALLRSRTDRAQSRAADCIPDLFHYQLRHGKLEKDVFYLVHSRPWLQILKGISKNWSAYWRNLRVLESQLHEEQLLHRRIIGLVRSIPGLKGLKLARGLARIKYGERFGKVKP